MDWKDIDVAAAFDEWSNCTTLKKSSVRAYKRAARTLERHGITRLGEISRLSVCRMQDARLAEGRRPATVNNDTKAIIALVRWLSRRVELPAEWVAGFARLRVKEPEAIPATFYTREQFINTLRPTAYAIAPWFGLAFELAVWTGVRRTELRCEMRDDYDLDGRLLRLTRATKFGRPRVVSLCPQAIAAVRLHAPTSGAMFPALSPQATQPFVSDDLFKWAMAELQDRTKIRCTWHKCRRTFTTWAIQDGVPPPDIARMLGHRDLRVLYRHYYVWLETYSPSIEKLGAPVAAA